MNTEWMKEARCQDYPVAIFFPQDGVGVLRAQKICAECPVREQCLEYVLDSHIEHGVWGGKSERERRRLQRVRRLTSLSA
jgi:WhiB family redox-sensing transcriptional regulator